MGGRRYEVIIVGSGIAGASLAYFLSEGGLTDVLLLEREEQLAVHSTGRSAATLSELDRIPALLDLKVQSAPFFQQTPPGFSESPLLRQSGVLNLFKGPGWAAIQKNAPALEKADLRFRLLSVDEARGIVPALEPAAFDGALLVPGDGRLDVHETLSSYLRHARARGVELRLGTEVLGFTSQDGRCTGVTTKDGDLTARLVVDAAGAWAGRIAQKAEAMPIPLVPHRRTIVIFRAPEGMAIGDWPLVGSDAHSLYFTPEAGELLLSPMDEDPMEPCDPTPDETVIAGGLARLGLLAPSLVPQSIQRRWSGLRTFSPDRVPVVGEDPKRPGFFWLAGQGGCGIETSPTMGRIAADLILTGETTRFDARRLAPQRFA